MNQQIIMGHLGKDPEGQTMQSGKRKVRFNVAVRRNDNDTDWFSCVAWEKTAESIEQYFRKGMRIIIIGNTRNSSYQNREQKTVYTSELNVDRWHFVDKKEENEQSRAAAPSSSGNQQQSGGMGYTPPDDDLPF